MLKFTDNTRAKPVRAGGFAAGGNKQPSQLQQFNKGERLTRENVGERLIKARRENEKRGDSAARLRFEVRALGRNWATTPAYFEVLCDRHQPHKKAGFPAQLLWSGFLDYRNNVDASTDSKAAFQAVRKSLWLASTMAEALGFSGCELSVNLREAQSMRETLLLEEANRRNIRLELRKEANTFPAEAFPLNRGVRLTARNASTNWRSCLEGTE